MTLFSRNLAELIVGQGRHRPVVRIGRRIADEHVDLTESAHCLIDQMADMFFRGNIRRHRDRAAFTIFRIDRRGDFVARLLIARRHDDLSAMLRHPLDNGATYAADEPVTTATLPLRSKSDTKNPPDYICVSFAFVGARAYPGIRRKQAGFSNLSNWSGIALPCICKIAAGHHTGFLKNAMIYDRRCSTEGALHCSMQAPQVRFCSLARIFRRSKFDACEPVGL